jgi:hypothetical protein
LSGLEFHGAASRHNSLHWFVFSAASATRVSCVND